MSDDVFWCLIYASLPIITVVCAWTIRPQVRILQLILMKVAEKGGIKPCHGVGQMTEQSCTLQILLLTGSKLHCQCFLEGNLWCSFEIKEMSKERSFLETPEWCEGSRFWSTAEYNVIAYLVEAFQNKYFYVFMTAFPRFTTNADISIQNNSFSLPLCQYI